MTIQERIFQYALKGSSKYFEKSPEVVMNKLSRYDIERYASWNLNMIDEDEADQHCNCRTIDYCNDSEIIEEYEKRGLKPFKGNIVKDDILDRFEKIAEIENPLKILAIIEQLEKENNL